MLATLKRWALAWIYAAGRYGEYGWIVAEAEAAAEADERAEREALRILRELSAWLALPGTCIGDGDVTDVTSTVSAVERTLQHLGYADFTVRQHPDDPTALIVRGPALLIINTLRVR
jgi:hypothetical protein